MVLVRRWDFGSGESAASNILSPAMLVNTLWTKLRPGVQVLVAVHYCSPRPLPVPELHAGAARLIARGRLLAGGGASVPGAKAIPKIRR